MTNIQAHRRHLTKDNITAVSRLVIALREIVKSEFEGERHIAFVYGSYAYGTYSTTSDVDILIVGEKTGKQRIGRMVSTILQFHADWGLPIDAEMPHERKLVATWGDVAKAVVGRGFRRRRDRLVATPVTKTLSFLHSNELRLRLVLNAFTGRTVLISGDATLLGALQRDARNSWVRILPLLLGLRTFTLQSFVDHLIGDRFRSGEGFLGFKDSLSVRKYLLRVFRPVLQECVRKRHLKCFDSGIFSVTDETWLRDFLSGR